MWCDIVPSDKAGTASAKVWDITPEPDNEFELRVTVFGCKGVPAADLEGTSDCYIRAYIDDDETQETDTHYRNTDGKPNFNYRLLFPISTPF